MAPPPDLTSAGPAAGSAPRPADLPEILLVEDEAPARKALKGILTRRGFKVREASSGGEAVEQAGEGDVGLVLMDIVLGDGPDGIEAAREIQQARPETAVIFVSAYASDPVYQQRAQQDVLNIRGWIEKPIQVPAIPELLARISRELNKVWLRVQLQEAEAEGRDPAERLDELARLDVASQEVAEELRQELAASPSSSSAALLSEEESEMQISAAIDAVYDEIRSVVVSRAGDPGLAAALRPLRRRLRALQEREADAMERRFRAHFRFDPDAGAGLLERARRLLGKRRG